MCMAGSVYISRLPVLSTFCTRSFGHIQQMAKLYNMIIPLKAVLKHLLKQNIGSQNYKIFTGTFYVIFFLNGILQYFFQVMSI